MKSRYLLLAGIAVMACLAGCSDNSLDNGMAKNPVQEGEEILFGSSLSDEVESRTVYGDRDENGVAVHWVEGDEIAIFCKETSQPANHLVNYKVTPSAGDPSKASEVMKVDPNAAGLQWGKDELHHFYAFYPASAVHGAESDDQQGTISASIPVNQQPAGWRTGPIKSLDENVNGETTTFALPNMNYAYMYAYNAVDRNTVESGSGTIWLQFHNLVTVLDITIPAPADGSTVTVTDVTVRAVGGINTILTGDFNCYIRGAGETGTPTCKPTGDMGQVRNQINIPCYNQETGEYVTLGGDVKFLNVKAYIIPDDENVIDKRTLQIAVNTLNGGEKTRTLEKASIVPHKVNRVLLPPVDTDGDKYWMSSLDPNIYVSELSIPGSKFSILTSTNKADNIYQNATIEQQFQDGIRAFIFQTGAKGSNTDGGLTPSKNTFSGDIKVVSEGADKEVMSLEDAVKEIASYLDKCEQAQKMNEFAFLMLTYATGGSSDNGTGYWVGLGNPGWHWDRHPRNEEQTWINLLRDKVNELAAVPGNRIYTGEITPNTTIDDVKGKIILKANYNSQDMLKYYTDSKSFVYNGPDVKTTAPLMFTFWGTSTGPDKSGDWTYQDNNGGMPMDWGVPVWYANSTAQLRWYYQEVTSVGTNKEATKQQKEDGIKHLFQESVDLYKNDNAHKTWFMNDLGGYYSDNGNINGRGTGIEALAIDMNNLGVQELQKRTENAGLGLIFMNFADKQSESGAKYKSDYLIQTIIMNNRKFQLRKKGSSEGGEGTKSYDASYNNGGNAIGWDK